MADATALMGPLTAVGATLIGISVFAANFATAVTFVFGAFKKNTLVCKAP
jgi:hypothetical protein